MAHGSRLAMWPYSISKRNRRLFLTEVKFCSAMEIELNCVGFELYIIFATVEVEVAKTTTTMENPVRN